jgi:hypothetical protein
MPSNGGTTKLQTPSHEENQCVDYPSLWNLPNRSDSGLRLRPALGDSAASKGEEPARRDSRLRCNAIASQPLQAPISDGGGGDP